MRIGEDVRDSTGKSSADLSAKGLIFLPQWEMASEMDAEISGVVVVRLQLDDVGLAGKRPVLVEDVFHGFGLRWHRVTGRPGTRAIRA